MSNHKDTKVTKAGRAFVRLVSLWLLAYVVAAATLDQPPARQD